ncbi:ankyrin repeat-containing domain protein [Cercophora newfieldiana]|uniref:Ankyrin repeat-containing domain protein n=1 Tax=Cercophora newfieldiana TaxID=92897 RepID=A0AA40CVZ5_9PEZI|nr:ankyrin repeat-containing domain protein [Cercophora newfieldiana]
MVQVSSIQTPLSLLKKLEHENDSKWNRLQWPFSEKENQNLAQEIRNFATWMHFALSLDGCGLLFHTSEDVARFLGRRLERFKVVQSFKEAQSTLAVGCLTYAICQEFGTGPCASEDEIRRRIKNYPFLTYDSLNLGNTRRMGRVDKEVGVALEKFFTSAYAPAMMNQVRQYAIGRPKEWWDAEESLSLKPLHYACRYGLVKMVNELLDKYPHEINITTKDGISPVIIAASAGHVGTLEALMKRGADPYLRNTYGNALHCAMEGNRPSTARELVATTEGHIFHQACAANCEKIVRLLIDRA